MQRTKGRRAKGRQRACLLDHPPNLIKGKRTSSLATHSDTFAQEGERLREQGPLKKDSLFNFVSFREASAQDHSGRGNGSESER